MFIIPPPQRKQKRIRFKPELPPNPPPVTALTLVAAEFSSDPFVDLTFDRAIDIENINLGAFRVNEQATGYYYLGQPDAMLISATTVRVPLVDVDYWEGTGLHLIAGAGNGIVAVDDGGTWSGTSDTDLPFP